MPISYCFKTRQEAEKKGYELSIKHPELKFIIVGIGGAFENATVYCVTEEKEWIDGCKKEGLKCKKVEGGYMWTNV